MESISKTFDDYRFVTMSSLISAAQLDGPLIALGANPRRPPPLHAGSTPDLLAWGVDSAISAARLLLCGQVLGAAVMIRNQLERWVLWRAGSLGLEQQSGESTIDFVARTWSQPDPFYDQWYERHVEVVSTFFDSDDVVSYEPPADHLHVYRSDGSDVCPAVTYGLLSELIHLRQLQSVPSWDTRLLPAEEDLFTDVMAAAITVSDAIFLALREIRLAALELAQRRGLRGTIELLSTGMDAISISEDQTEKRFEAIPFGHARTRETEIPPIAALAPLLPREGLEERSVAVVERFARDYDAIRRGARPAGRLYVDDEFLVRSFCWHRRRSIQFARLSLDAERRMMGAEFNIDSMSGRAAQWVLLTEAAGMLSLWHPIQGVQIAAAAFASSLRSTYWLWLEDDDRAMAVLRSSLEYVARLRTWRRKPARAQDLENRSTTTPRDWITQAGWRRLFLLNQILGEFSHARKMDDWPTARRLLADLQIDVDSEKAIFTARGAAIDFTASLAAREVTYLLSEVSVPVAGAISRILGELEFELDETVADVEAQFAHIWSVRTKR